MLLEFKNNHNYCLKYKVKEGISTVKEKEKSKILGHHMAHSHTYEGISKQPCFF